MEKKNLLILLLASYCLVYFSQCSEKESKKDKDSIELEEKQALINGGFNSQVKFGEHLVLIAGCNDCHTPKKMTERGPVLDSSLWLSGHPAQMPPPDVDRKNLERKGIAATNTLTAWVGPWGISFAANLTSDDTGIGNWQESNFFNALRQGKHKGIHSGREILPPMPWEMYRHMTDEELRAVFAYLKSTTPIKNTVPDALAPTSAQSH